MRLSTRALLATLLAGALTTGAHAQLRDYCPDRPGINTPPCTIDPGRLSVEVSGVDWTHDRTDNSVDDMILIGDLALRYGIADHAELRLAWTPYGHVRSRDRVTGAVSSDSGVGDVTIGIKRNLIDPTGGSFSVALLPSVTLPTGGEALGAGDWSASMLLPVNVPLSSTVALIATPEIDAATDADGHGRHLAFGTSLGFGIAASDHIALSFEGSILRDDDPDGASTQSLVAASVGWSLGDNTQLDVSTEVGIAGGAPDRRIYAGIARRF